MRLFYLMLTLLYSVPLYSQTLKLGDPAPQIRVNRWLKGNPIKDYDNGKIYVLEFWASWCGPCKEMIPHINFLSTKYSNKVKFIGINVWETNPEKAEANIKSIANKMKYPVAADQGQRGQQREAQMTKTVLDALNIKGLPASVVIGTTGLIEWVGHPSELEKALLLLVQNRSIANIRLESSREFKLDSLQKTIGNNPNWSSIESMLNKKFPHLSSDSILLSWQFPYYQQGGNVQLYLETLIKFTEKYDSKLDFGKLNDYAWNVFRLSNNYNQLSSAAKWLEPGKVDARPEFLDTYANILYKMKKPNEALKIQTKALQILDNDIYFSDLLLTYYKISTGQPTWTLNQVAYSNNKKVWQRGQKYLSQYSSSRADSLVFLTKVKYMKESKQWGDLVKETEAFSSVRIKLISSWLLNNIAWSVFVNSENNTDLLKCLEWSKITLVDDKYKNIRWAFYDTNANILYKLGRRVDAIQAIKMAIRLCPENKKVDCQNTLAKMEMNKPTW